MPPLVLRLPEPRGGEPGYACCEVSGPWIMSTRGLALALCELSSRQALAELARRAGQSALWSPGQPLAGAPWRDAGWGPGWVSASRWEADSVEAFEARFREPPGRPAPAEPWTAAGFAWCPEHGCWMAVVYTYRGGSERGEPARFGLHPAAATVWGWDRDPIAEGPHALEDADLLRMASTMGVKGVEALSRGVEAMSGMGGPSESIRASLREIAALAEDREIERAAARGKAALGQGHPRL